MKQYFVEHPKFDGFNGYFTREPGEGIVHKIAWIGVKEKEQGHGIGARVHGRQVYWGIKYGVKRFKLDAAAGKKLNGFITWPIFGYDGRIPDAIRAEMPENLRGCETIQALLAIPDGRDWWESAKRGINNLTFDLAEGSRSRWIWADYWGRKPRSKNDS